MKNTVKTIFGLAALALVAAGCNVTDPRPTYVPEGDGVTFLQSAVSATSLVSGTTSYSIDLARSSADEALTVNLTGSIYASTDPETDMAADFKMPESVTFESGEYLAKITLDVSKMEVGVTYSGTISLSDGQECFNPNTATTSTAVRLAMDYNWVELGEAQWYDGFMLAVSNDNMNIQKCRMTKAEIGHFAKAGVAAGRGLWEFRLEPAELEAYQVGSEIKVDAFADVKKVDVTGQSKGKGTAGTVKRYNFRTQDFTHGNSRSHRVPGSIGQNQTPGRVFKGKKMVGRMGNERVTVQCLDLVRIDQERNLLLVKGAVPGANNGDVIVRPSVKA